MRGIWIGGGLLALLGISLWGGIGGAAAAPEDDDPKLWADFEAAFRPLPVDRMFTDLDRELRISRRDPFSGRSRGEIAKPRAKLKLRRERIREERRKRLEVVRRLGERGGPRAAKMLIEACERAQEDIAAAKKILERHLEASRIDINPGVDPGGVNWERWLRRDELPAARGVLADERKVADLALETCAGLMTPEIRDWIAKNAASHALPEIRERMIRLLAGVGKPWAVAALAGILESERQVWACCLVLDVIGRAKTPGTASLVLASLSDEAWPVRSAAVAAARALGLRDVPAIDALVASLGDEEGRLRLEMRDALAAATGQAFGLHPEEWKLWWGASRQEWKASGAPAKVAPLPDRLPAFFGIPTASRRLVFLVSRGRGMSDPVKRRPFGNDGKPSPKPAVDTAWKIASWELSETLASLPPDARFTVIVYGDGISFWSRKPRRASKEARKSVASYLRKFFPGRGSRLAPALEAALRLGVPRRVTDLALAGEGEVDTIFVVGEAWGNAGGLGAPTGTTSAAARLSRLRRVVIHTVRVGRGRTNLRVLAAATGGRSRSIAPK